VNTTIIHNTYNKTVAVNRTTVNNVSFNGGKGGTTAQPTSQEKVGGPRAARQPHPTAGRTRARGEPKPRAQSLLQSW
jgi:hypothetical protein